MRKYYRQGMEKMGMKDFEEYNAMVKRRRNTYLLMIGIETAIIAGLIGLMVGLGL
jgi:hypothetical protein